MFGYCSSGKHNDCIKKYQRFYVGPVGKGRKKTQGVILLDEWRECDCYCHRPVEEKPKRAPRARRKK